MKRSEINALVESAKKCFEAHGWTLPPEPRWDVTDFGLGDWRRHGLVLLNLAEEPEYCEKLMYARKGMRTPSHCHRKKKEDIIARWGSLIVMVWPSLLDMPLDSGDVSIKVNGVKRSVQAGTSLTLNAGERVTLPSGVYHEFAPVSDECIIGEVSTANDDLNDNVFADPEVGRFPDVDEDEPPVVRLISER